jgi:hypothetical protein
LCWLNGEGQCVCGCGFVCVVCVFFPLLPREEERRSVTLSSLMIRKEEA